MGDAGVALGTQLQTYNSKVLTCEGGVVSAAVNAANSEDGYIDSVWLFSHC